MLECSIELQEISSVGTKGLLKDLACVAPKIGEWAASLAGKNIVCGAALLAGWEQEPIWSNHVKLSEAKRDRFGIPMVELHWKKSERDRLTLQKGLTHFNDYLIARNRGRIRAEDWVFAKDGYPVRGDDGVSYHHMPGVSGGFVGVDVFFVLSGFLITGLLVAEVRKTSELSLVQFYARRVRRLLPASALTLTVTLLIGAMILAPHELDVAGHASRAAAFNISNIFFDINAGDYFAPDVKANPILHTWSLAVEEQFYLFWPLLLLLSLVRCKSTKVLTIVIAGLTFVSLLIGVWFSARGATFAFYELPARACAPSPI